MSAATLPLFTMYTTNWCGDCYRTKHWLDTNGFQVGKDYIEIDIEQDDSARLVVEKINHGRRTIPTLVFPDGTTLTEPNNLELANKLRTSPLAN